MEDIKIITSPGQILGQDPSHKKENAQAAPGTFADILKDSIKQVNSLQMDADKAIQDLTTGSTHNIHETMIAIEKAGISFKMMMRVRDNILEAYREIMHMQF